MSDPQRPNPDAPRFEVPDLELEPVPRSLRQAAPVAAPPPTPRPATRPGSAQDQLFGSTFDFGDELEELEFERTAQPNLQLAGERALRPDGAKRAEPPAADAGPPWPTGRAPVAAELVIDAHELSILADYGEPPDSVPLTLGYAYRVFTRQRELKHQLLPMAAECERAQIEREATLAELGRELRPAIEQITAFRRVLAPLVEIEQRAAARGHALNSINSQRDGELGQLDVGLDRLKSQIEIEQRLEGDAQRQYDAREANAKRVDAKLKRIQIGMRAVARVAEQKLGPQGGQIPDAEAAQLADLRARAEALGPEGAQAQSEFEQAKQALSQAHARLEALRQNERQIGRKKQALAGVYQKQLSARSQGLSEVEIEQRAALADLARAALAARGTLDIPEAWLERVRNVGARADALIVRTEMQRRAIASYDGPRARQGVRLACTAVGLLLVLFVFKLIF